MGDFKEENGSEFDPQGQKKKSRLIAVIILIIGLFAPIMMTMNFWGMGFQFDIQSIFWMYSTNPYFPGFLGFYLTPVYSLVSIFPFLLLRMVPVSQIYRYYNGNTTRKRAFIAAAIGDGVFLIMTVPSMILMAVISGFYFLIPLPFQMIAGILILWRSPLPGPKTPWSKEEEPKSWWEKSSDSDQQKKPTDDDGVLW